MAPVKEKTTTIREKYPTSKLKKKSIKVLGKMILIGEEDRKLIDELYRGEASRLDRLRMLGRDLLNIEKHERAIAAHIEALDNNPSEENYKLLQTELNNLEIKLDSFSDFVKKFEEQEIKNEDILHHVLNLDRKVHRAIRRGRSALRKAERAF